MMRKNLLRKHSPCVNNCKHPKWTPAAGNIQRGSQPSQGKSSVTSIGELAFYCDNLTKVVSLIEDPFEIIGKEFNRRTFPLHVFNNATLYVPEGTIEKYRKTAGWKDFWHIEEGSHTSLKSIEANSISINGKGGMLTIDGAVEGTPVIVYDTTGRLLASAMTTRQAARIATPLRKGAVAIVKVGDRVEKVVMK